MKIINLTIPQHKTLKTYSKSAMEFISHIKTVDRNKPIEDIGFHLKRMEQALEYVIGIIDKIKPNDGIETTKKRINEIIAEHEKTLLLYLKRPDRFIEGKIEGYKNCLKIIDKYIG